MSEVGRLASVGTLAGLLAERGPALGLAAEVTPFAREGSLAERLGANPFLMAPMAGVTDAAWRVLARAGGAALACTEMVSVAGIHYGSEATWALVEPDEAEPDLAVQLFGHDPGQFREAAAQVAERLGDRLAVIDINMACPVPKVTRKGEGSALLDDPDRAAAIVRACREGLDDRVPVTAKIRIGRTPDRIVAAEFARVLEQAGASAVAVHGRTASQLYRGSSDPDRIAEVVRAVSMPVIASGDALSAHAAATLLERTGAAGIYVARGSYGDPWVFSRARALAAGKEPPEPTFAMRIDCLELHVRMLSAEGAHLARARSLVGWYLKGMPHATDLRRRGFECETLDDYLGLCELARSVAVDPA